MIKGLLTLIELFIQLITFLIQIPALLLGLIGSTFAAILSTLGCLAGGAVIVGIVGLLILIVA